MTSSLTLRYVFGFLALSFFLLLGSIATNLNEQRKYRLRIVQGLLFTQSISCCSALYIWTHLSKTTGVQVVKTLLAVLLVLAQFPVIAGYILSNVEPNWFLILLYICFAIMMLLLTLTVFWQVLDILAQLLSRRKKHFSTNSFKAATILLLTVVLTTLALYNGTRAQQVNYFRVSVRNLPTSFQGLRVLQLSDVHIGPTIGKTQVEQLVKLSNEQKPDLVLFTGDLVDAPMQIKPAVQSLANLKSTYGSFFVAGNHDFYTGYIDEWITELQQLNISVLHNRYTQLVSKYRSKPGDKVYLAGVFDHEGGMLRSPSYGQNLAQALNGREPGVPTIVMAHRPSAAKTAVTHFSDISLVVCGHTHGGQILPFVFWHYISEPYFAGLYKVGKQTYVHVSSGVFHWGMPMRQFSRPDITMFILE